MSKTTLLAVIRLVMFVSIASSCVIGFSKDNSGDASLRSSIASDGTGSIIVEAHGQLPELPVMFSARADATAVVSLEHIDQTIALDLTVIQGDAKTLSLAILGKGDVTEVQGETLRSWSVRKEDSQRFLDLSLSDGETELKATIKIRSKNIPKSLPATVQLTHLGPGKSVGFNSVVNLRYDASVQATVTDASGFAPLEGRQTRTNNQVDRFQSVTGGLIAISIDHSGRVPEPVEFSDTSLTGELHPNGKSIRFQFKSTAQVTEENAVIDVLSGNIAVSKTPVDKNFRLRLSTDSKQPVYKLAFPEAGEFPVTIDFVAAVTGKPADGHRMSFTVATSAIVPLLISGFNTDLQFRQETGSITPIRRDKDWVGFLPASGQANMKWKAARKTGEGKLFFTTTGIVEAKVGTGLLRQDHQIDFRVLQGELKALKMQLYGPGEILDVQGTNITSWNVVQKDQERLLDVVLSQPITGASQIKVRSQTPLGAFPARVEGLRVIPVDVIRHSGYLRLTNSGLVRLEPTDLSGLTQLAPEQFPAKPTDARQCFVYRFPSGKHAFSVAANRIKPEVNLSEIVRYQLTDSDRVILADIELDIREAPIREWNFLIPADYSVVSVVGGNVADYVSASETTKSSEMESGVQREQRNLKVIFGADISGRHLVKLNLEKNESETEEKWELPKIEHPDAKTVRGDVGILAAPGFRILPEQTDLLIEKPRSYFPIPSANLQQAFRVRQRAWSATMRIEKLEQNIQSDVFHLYSLTDEMIYGSSLINYFVSGSPVSQFKISAPENLGNVMVVGQDLRAWRRDGDTLIVSLHQPIMGAHTLLVTYEEKPDRKQTRFTAGQITPLDVQGERGYIQVVSPMQVEIETATISDDLLKLDPLELPAEFRLLSTAPAIGTWQYTTRPFDLDLKVFWFEPGTTVSQVVEFSEAKSRVSKDGELVTDVTYFVKTRGGQSLKIKLPDAPVRLWATSVNGQPVTARQTDEATLIPLPSDSTRGNSSSGTDPNVPVEVRLRLGKPSVNSSNAQLQLPIVFAPVLKTQWDIVGEEQYVLVPGHGTVSPSRPVLHPSGFQWLSKHGLPSLALISLFVTIGIWVRGIRREDGSGLWRVIGLSSILVALWFSVSAALAAVSETGPPNPLQLSVPVLSSGEVIELQVSNIPLWRVNLSWVGSAVGFIGLVAIAWSFLKLSAAMRWGIRFAGIAFVMLGVLMQGDGARWFFALITIAIGLLLFIPEAWKVSRDFVKWLGRKPEGPESQADNSSSISGGDFQPVTSVILMFLLLMAGAGSCMAGTPKEYRAADSIKQQWRVSQRDSRLMASGTVMISGQPGDQFLLLQSPAVLTQFDGKGLRLSKSKIQDKGLAYVISIPAIDRPDEDEFNEEESSGDSSAEKINKEVDYKATFEYQLQAISPLEGIPVLTGTAAVQEVNFGYDQPGWNVICPHAAMIESDPASQKSSESPSEATSDTTSVYLLLKPSTATGSATISLRPKSRDVTAEKTQFFVEAANLYLPGPGVVDGRHHLKMRVSQGQVSELSVIVPSGLTVSSVNGPVGSWQFDADRGRLTMEVAPSQSKTFDIMIKTQRGLAPLPTDAVLEPLKVEKAGGEVGLVGIAFGKEAQPEKLESKGMPSINVGDFDAKLLPSKQSVLHRVYRYGAEGGQLIARIAPVAPDVRVASKQVLSLGDERMVLGVNFTATITRAGLFRLSFPLPKGFEVESLSGSALHHWAELSSEDDRQIVIHLNGKTIGTQSFTMTLSGLTPSKVDRWQIPRFELNEANRQSGDLVVRPTTGIRLRTVSRQNVSEADPRSIGNTARGNGVTGTLAFRLLQRDWNLVLGIEKLDPWVTGQVLHQVTIREGQTRTAVIGNFNVENASIQSMKVKLPVTDEDEIKTLRAIGESVSDFVRTAPDSNVWEVQFKRRVVGKFPLRIEYERRGDRKDENESLLPLEFPEVKQLPYFFSVRSGGRLELEHAALPEGWQRLDWNMVPSQLREAENRNTPALTLRAASPTSPLMVQASRHSLADALKLRVAKGVLTSVLSPTGDQLTAIDLEVEVIQRSSLHVGLPEGGELLSIFVNGESVNSIRDSGNANTWKFTVLPGIDDRTASVRFFYVVTGNQLNRLRLMSPQLNAPLENIQWNVVAPEGFQLTDNEGNLELIRQSQQKSYDRNSYLSKVSGKRKIQAEAAANLLKQANQLLQAGEQTKARRAFNSVANQYALDAASNEDARVQLENLHTQQAIVGLNTRRQRFYLDTNQNAAASAGDKQLRDAAASNPILQDKLDFQPQQFSQLLRGNTAQDNAVLSQIAQRLVQHQRATQLAPQSIIINLPEEGSVYTFKRSVQVAEDAPLELDLKFDRTQRLHFWQIASAMILLAAFAAILAYAATLHSRQA